MIYKVTHTRNIDVVTEYYVESDDEFYPEDLAVDAVIDFNNDEKIPDGVKVTVRQVDETEYDEIFDVDEVESDD